MKFSKKREFDKIVNKSNSYFVFILFSYLGQMDSSSSEPNSDMSINSLQELISALHKIFESDNVNIENAKKVIESYQSNAKDWKKYCVFDQHRYVVTHAIFVNNVNTEAVERNALTDHHFMDRLSSIVRLNRTNYDV